MMLHTSHAEVKQPACLPLTSFIQTLMCEVLDVSNLHFCRPHVTCKNCYTCELYCLFLLNCSEVDSVFILQFLTAYVHVYVTWMCI